MKRNLFIALLMCVLCFAVYAQEENLDTENLSIETETDDYSPVHLKYIFHNFGWNLLGSVTYNYGFNLAAAGLGTWAIVETGIDWKWRNTVYDNTWISDMGRPGLYIGYVVPGITPVAFYTAGLITKDEKMQLTAMALIQSLGITFAIQSPLKMATGKTEPHLVSELNHLRYDDPKLENPPTGDFSRKFNWWSMDPVAGWPSGHTSNAFAAAATIAEMYKEDFWVKFSAYSYATLIGAGVTLNVHWVSEAFAGALIGYAVGKTVGRSYRKLLDGKEEPKNYSLYFTPNTIGIIFYI